MAESPVPCSEKRTVESLIFEYPHWEALTSNTLLAFHHLNEQKFIRRFYLAGGTGLALHLGHRLSIDLDFFSENPTAVDQNERSEIQHSLEDPTLIITDDKEGTFLASWKEVGISFFRLDQYPVVTPLLALESIQVASVMEIGAMKLAAIIGRGTRKALLTFTLSCKRYLSRIFSKQPL